MSKRMRKKEKSEKRMRKTEKKEFWIWWYSVYGKCIDGSCYGKCVGSTWPTMAILWVVLDS